MDAACFLPRPPCYRPAPPSCPATGGTTQAEATGTRLTPLARQHLMRGEVKALSDSLSDWKREMLQGTQLAFAQKTALHHPKAKVLFQFFDGWPMSESGGSNVE